jgi:hypothetical protein
MKCASNFDFMASLTEEVIEKKPSRLTAIMFPEPVGVDVGAQCFCAPSWKDRRTVGLPPVSRLVTEVDRARAGASCFALVGMAARSGRAAYAATHSGRALVVRRQPWLQQPGCPPDIRAGSHGPSRVAATHRCAVAAKNGASEWKSCGVSRP